jgi:S-adenosylmethionine:tRNA ribosyltransferase-isomerase
LHGSCLCPFPPPTSLPVDSAQFDYDLPQSAIAQVPADRRDQSRLILVNRSTGQVADHMFHELPDLLPRPTTFFRNDVKVLQARLKGQRSGGGSCECLLLYPDPNVPVTDWWCLLRPGKRLPAGSTIDFANAVTAEVVEKTDEGTARLHFHLGSYASVSELAEAIGIMPLPPYIHRAEEDPRNDIDKDRYQTIYADPEKPFAAAAPTAGLHFTRQINDRLLDQSHRFFNLTLHVGLGTFKPIQSERVEEHPMHDEYYEIPGDTREALNVRDNRLKLAVGTTSLRAMEDYFRSIRKSPTPTTELFAKPANLFVYPPALFTTDALLTNFHLPKSTLLCLVSAFLTPGSTDGIDWLKQIYQAALKRNYRFYSYGDAMLIL